jgi:hypothetical protein
MAALSNLTNFEPFLAVPTLTPLVGINGGLFVSLGLIPSLSFLSIILPVLFLLFLLLIAFNIQFYCNRWTTLVNALLSAFLIAWCLSITFPIT